MARAPLHKFNVMTAKINPPEIFYAMAGPIQCTEKVGFPSAISWMRSRLHEPKTNLFKTLSMHVMFLRSRGILANIKLHETQMSGKSFSGHVAHHMILGEQLFRPVFLSAGGFQMQGQHGKLVK